MREADFDCARYSACSDPSLPDPAAWGWSELLLIGLIVAAIIWLLWAISKPAKPEKTLEQRVDELLGGAETEARNWSDPEAVALLQRTRQKITAEFRKG